MLAHISDPHPYRVRMAIGAALSCLRDLTRLLPYKAIIDDYLIRRFSIDYPKKAIFEYSNIRQYWDYHVGLELQYKAILGLPRGT